MLHVAGVVTFYKAFLGMEPHVDLFRRIFSERALSEGKPPRIMSVGGFSLQNKPKLVTPYPAYTPCDYNRGWYGECFYIRNPAEVPFPPFIGRRPERRESWSWGPSSQQNKLEVIEVKL